MSSPPLTDDRQLVPRAVAPNGHERRLHATFVAELTAELARLSAPDDILSVVGERTGAYLGITSCTFSEVDEAADEIRVAYSWRRGAGPSLQRTFRIADYLSEDVRRASREGHVVVVRDTAADPRTHTDAHAALGIRSFVTIPFHREGQWRFLLTLADGAPRGWRQDEIALFQDIGGRMFPRVERARAEQALRASEQRFRKLFESMDDGFCIVEVILDDAQRPADYRFIEVNPVFGAQTGMQGALGRTVRELVPNIEEHWIQAYGRVALTGESTRFVDHAPSMGRWFDVNAFRIGAPHERRVAVLFSDITHRKEAEKALQDSEARHAFLVRLGDEVRAIADPVEIERRVTRLLGEHLGASRSFYVDYDDDAGVGDIHDDYAQGQAPSIAGRYRIEDFPSIHAVFRTGEAVILQDVLTVPGMTEHERAQYGLLGIRSAVGVPLVKNDKLVAMLAVGGDAPRDWTPVEVSLVRDTAERTWAAVERARAEAAVRAADRRKDEFLATLAHELRNPLAPLRNGLQIARLTGRSDATLQRTVDMMDRQLTHLVRLVDDLLDVGRISAGKLQLRREPVSLARVLASSVEASQVAIDRQRHQLTVQLESDELMVLGDFDRLTQVFNNLLSNAAKYTEPGGSISVQMRRDGECAVITVADTGIGIPTGDLQEVFELFSQVRLHQGRTEGGLGIGLALVRSLVLLHGGKVEARSSGPSQGSSFIVKLPLHADETGDTPQPVAERAPVAGRRILVADDNGDAAATLAALLEMDGHEVWTAEDGVAALEKAREVRPDLIFLDLGMPRMGGLDAARQLRAEGLAPPARLVALTGWGQESDRRRTRDAGFDAHLVKPVDMAALQAVVTG